MKENTTKNIRFWCVFERFTLNEWHFCYYLVFICVKCFCIQCISMISHLSVICVISLVVVITRQKKNEAKNQTTGNIYNSDQNRIQSRITYKRMRTVWTEFPLPANQNPIRIRNILNCGWNSFNAKNSLQGRFIKIPAELRIVTDENTKTETSKINKHLHPGT